MDNVGLQPAGGPPATTVYPGTFSGAWDLLADTTSWSQAPQLLPQVHSLQQVHGPGVLEYPVNGPVLAGSGDSGELYPDYLAPTLPPPQYPPQLRDSLLPPDAYAQPPPQYPLYNWTLPYGPELVAAPVIPVTPAAQLWGVRSPSEPATEASSRPTNGIRVQFKGPSEVRQQCRQQQDAGDSPSFRQHTGLIQPLAGGSVVGLEGLEGLQGLDGQDEEVVEVEVRTSHPDEASNSNSERITFNSIEEALATIEEGVDLRVEQTPPALQTAAPAPAPTALRAPSCWAPRQRSHVQAVPVGGRRLGLADEKQEEVVKAAKSLFSKRTRTLYHWLYPETSKTKLKATVSAAWDTLAEAEKQFYLSQVLGRFGLQASSLMINPQLDGIKGLPVPELGPSWPPPAPPPRSVASRSTASHVVGPGGGGHGGDYGARGSLHVLRPPSPRLTEVERAVNQLFASCEDSDTWTSYNMRATSPCSAPTVPAPPPPPILRSDPKPRSLYGYADRRKRVAARAADDSNADSASANRVDEEVTILKRMRESRMEAELEDDAELSSELEKFRLLASDVDQSTASCNNGDDFWRRTPDPDDILTQLNF